MGVVLGAPGSRNEAPARGGGGGGGFVGRVAHAIANVGQAVAHSSGVPHTPAPRVSGGGGGGVFHHLAQAISHTGTAVSHAAKAASQPSGPPGSVQINGRTYTPQQQALMEQLIRSVFKGAGMPELKDFLDKFSTRGSLPYFQSGPQGGMFEPHAFPLYDNMPQKADTASKWGTLREQNIPNFHPVAPPRQPRQQRAFGFRAGRNGRGLSNPAENATARI